MTIQQGLRNAQVEELDDDNIDVPTTLGSDYFQDKQNDKNNINNNNEPITNQSGIRDVNDKSYDEDVHFIDDDSVDEQNYSMASELPEPELPPSPQIIEEPIIVKEKKEKQQTLKEIQKEKQREANTRFQASLTQLKKEYTDLGGDDVNILKLKTKTPIETAIENLKKKTKK